MRGTRPGSPVARAWTLPSAWYAGEEHLARERDRIFARTWQLAAREEQLARRGDYVTAGVGGEPVVVVRGDDGKLRAFYNVCRHRAGTVAPGEGGCVKAFRCTYHGWTYRLDGALRTAPEMDGVERFEANDFGLVPVRCEAWSGLIFVNLDPRAKPLAKSVGCMPEMATKTGFASMRFARRDVYPIACNWKVYVDNYLEGYHIPAAHPGLHKVLDYRRYEVETDGPIVIQRSPGRGESRSDERYLYVWVWPNFMLNVSPGYAQTNLIVPDGPHRTLCVFDYFFAGAEDADAIAFSDGIQAEDIAICESVQRNLGSRAYEAGRYSAKRENGLHHFHELVRRALKTGK
jgi:choline monooxygenase